MLRFLEKDDVINDAMMTSWWKPKLCEVHVTATPQWTIFIFYFSD